MEPYTKGPERRSVRSSARALARPVTALALTSHLRKAMAVSAAASALEGAISQSGPSLGVGMGGLGSAGATVGHRTVKGQDGAHWAVKHGGY